jgi:elongation factor P
MSSVQATRLRKGMLIKIGEDLFRILELHHMTPGNKRGFVQARMRNIRTTTLTDTKFRAEEDHFMDTGSYEQIHIAAEVLGDTVGYLIPEMTIHVEFYGDEAVGIELPQTVDLKVLETTPAIKGATASAQLKPARLETGLVVQVPPFVNEGDVIRVNTESGEYQSRV